MSLEKAMGRACDISEKGKGCELLVDTGTYLTYIPRKFFHVSFHYLSKYLNIIKLKN